MQGVYHVVTGAGRLWARLCYRAMAEAVAAQIGGTVVMIHPDCYGV